MRIDQMRVSEFAAIVEGAGRASSIQASGRSQSYSGAGGIHIHTPRQSANYFLAKVVAKGPNGQEDFTDHHYWLDKQMASFDSPVRQSLADDYRIVRGVHLNEVAAASHSLPPDTFVIAFPFVDAIAGEGMINAFVSSSSAQKLSATLIAIGDETLDVSLDTPEGVPGITITIAKPWSLRRSTYDDKTLPNGWLYNYIDAQYRTATKIDKDTENQYVTPTYYVGDKIRVSVVTPNAGVETGDEDGSFMTLEDANADGRAWSLLPPE